MLYDMEFMKQKKEQTKLQKQQEMDIERAKRQAIGEQVRARNEKMIASQAEQEKSTRESSLAESKAQREHALKERELSLKEKAFNEE